MPIEIIVLDEPGAAPVVAELINAAYLVAEAGLWRPNTPRTAADEVAELITAGELSGAFLDGELVGCVRVHAVADGIFEFGMLVAASAHRGRGLGSRLIAHAEALAVAAGAHEMRLDLLVPAQGTHPTKVLLAAWYSGHGYRQIDTIRAASAHPALARLLAVPCEVQVWQKLLPSGSNR